MKKPRIKTRTVNPISPGRELEHQWARVVCTAYEVGG
jgi:hypothetical protein